MTEQNKLLKSPKHFKQLTDEQLKLIDGITDVSEVVKQMIENIYCEGDIDYRWVSIAKTHFQEGFMAIKRAVARPDCF